MKEKLFIRINSDERSLQWGILSGDEEGHSSFTDRGRLLIEDIETLGEQVSEQTVVLMLPAHRVKCFNEKTPTKNRKQLEKAIPYQLEEQILDNVDNQHFALGSFDAQDRLAINVVDKQYLAETLEQFKEVGVEPDFVISEAACLPYFNDAWSTLIEEQVFVRQEPNVFWSADKSLVEELLKLELQRDELSVSQAIRIYATEKQELNLDAVPGLATQYEVIEDTFQFLAHNFDEAGLNLLQQEFSSQKKVQRNYGVWKLPAIAASVVCVLGIVYLVSHIIHLNQQYSNLEERTLAETKKIYPTLPLTTAKIQINNSYRSIGGDSGSETSFALLMDKAIKAMDARSINFTQMEYIASRGELSMDVSAESYDILTRSQRSLESSGLKASMRNASENGGVWSARITVGLNK
ncbi:type II secretion system protein GspL [Kangiella marina]|uniref:Type II secretion system protein L n=1 Tax=Kangiella marina TaxID=1079178 RepID=A0ABP8IHR7_9GAMM